MDFKVVGDISDIQTIAKNRKICELNRLQKTYGSGNWRKVKGIARIQLSDGTLCLAELHWYEAHSIGKKEFKIKRFLD